MVQFLFAPYCQEAFAFERDWWVRGMAQFQRVGGNARHIAFPPHWLWLQRSLAGLHAVLVRMQVTASLADLARM